MRNTLITLLISHLVSDELLIAEYLKPDTKFICITASSFLSRFSAEINSWTVDRLSEYKHDLQ